MFIRELKLLKQVAKPQWLILGDFNLICKQQDKNNARINMTLLSRFQRALNHLQVRELNLMGKKFTWSNNQSAPTMSKINNAFCTTSWELLFAKPTLYAFSSSSSDHCPLLLVPFSAPQFRPKFKFESFWVDIPGFKDEVSQSWNKITTHNLNHMMTLHVKLSRVAKDIRTRSRRLIPHPKITMTICREVILQLETEQEARALSNAELALMKTLKLRILGRAAIEKTRARQKSRITWLRKGDANTKYFHLMANLRKQRNHILALQVDNSMVFSEKEKQQAVFSHFQSHIGTHVPRTCLLNLGSLEWQS
jgi:hypothetical protein